MVGHLYPDYLNIYADRGNIAVLDAARGLARARARRPRRSSSATRSTPAPSTSLYVGGGQDREQALDRARPGGARARRCARRSTRGAACSPSAAATSCSAAATATAPAPSCPAPACFPHETVAGERRMIGDVLLECELEPGERRTLAGFENHAGRTLLDDGRRAARPRRRRLRQRRRERLRGLPRRARDRHLPARPAAAAQPVARRLAARPARRASRPADARASSRCRTSSSARRMQSPPSGQNAGVDGSDDDVDVGISAVWGDAWDVYQLLFRRSVVMALLISSRDRSLRPPGGGVCSLRSKGAACFAASPSSSPFSAGRHTRRRAV